MALDACEPEIIRALEKDGWQILSKPLFLRVLHSIFIDLRVQRVFDGQEQQILVMEIKCFTNPDDDLQELYTAIGQYTYYQAMLQLKAIDLQLYLAIPAEAYDRLISDEAIRRVFENVGIKLVIVDIVTEEVIRWVG